MPFRNPEGKSNWTVEVPELRAYGADVWSCLTSETRMFLSGLRVVREVDPVRRGHICYVAWINGNREVAASDWESLVHEIGHAIALRERADERVSESHERAATAFFEAADAYQDWIQSRRAGERMPLAWFTEKLADDARECLVRYFRPAEQHVLHLLGVCD